MYKLNLLTLFILSYLFSGAQITQANDSVVTGLNNVNMVFYNLATGAKTVSSNRDWHIAVTVRQGMSVGATTIRINEAQGVNAYIAPNQDSTSFTNFDTTGWSNWWHLHDSDTSIDDGALNSNRGTNQFDFGWGFYDFNNYNLYGDSIYLLQLPSGEMKKLIVEDLVFDTAFDIKYANLDNSHLQIVHIGLPEYAGKNFVYLNLDDDSIRDKEPLSSDWDLEFLKYAAVDTPGVKGSTIPVAGVWLNYGFADINAATTVATGPDTDADTTFTGLPFSGNLNTIDWSATVITDSINSALTTNAYFIRTQGGEYYKLVFTGYGFFTGTFYFDVTPVSAPNTAVTGVEAAHTVAVFPNPASETLNIVLSQPAQQFQIADLNGRILADSKFVKPYNQLDISSLSPGVYVISVKGEGGVSYSKFIKQ